MKSITKKQILESIGKVYEQSKNCKLENSFFESIKPELHTLSQYFKTSPNQTFFIAMVFALNYKGDTVDLNDLIDYFECNPMKILEYSDDFEYLHKVGILDKKKSTHRVKLAGANDQFIINEKITEAILQNKPLPIINKRKVIGIIDLLEELYRLGNQRDDDNISTFELFREVEKLIADNTHFPLIEKVKQFSLSTQDTYLFLYLIWKTVTGNKSTDIGRALEGIYERPSDRVSEIQKLLSGNHILINNNLVEIIEAQFFNDTEMKLTATSLQLLSDCDIKLFLNKKKKDNIIVPSEVIYRELVFDNEEMKQLETLQTLLHEDKYHETQTRLANKGLPKGIAVLLHGAPGTGKTEIVKQLAKATDREIMKVEISQSKSMWFGESEKIIKRIFSDYRAYAKESELTPILLFNEADAIISKRKENSNSNVAQTENAIQNIILEELENFEGILMATTNLANNLDRAFERRFLFKIPFSKPKKEVRAKIWKSKLSHLDDESCQILADKFDFSGGQIDNIIRKSEILEIVHGTVANLEQIQLFCNEESIITKTTKIGFGYAHN